MLFTVKVSFFSAVCGVSVLRKNVYASVTVVVAFTALVLYAVFQDPRIAIVAMSTAAIAAIISGVGSVKRQSARRLVPLLQIIFLAGVIAYPLSRTRVGGHSLLTEIMQADVIANLMMRVLPNFPFLYNIPGYGHQLGEKSIGDRPALTQRPVFRVTGEPGETVYLRTAVYENFTGKGWVRSTESSSGEVSSKNYFTVDPPAEYECPLRVEILIDFFSYVPHTLDTQAINFFRGDFPHLAASGFGTGFLFDVPVVRGTVFYLDRAPFSDNFDDGGANEASSAGAERFPLLSSSYLQLPESIPGAVRALAEALKGNDPLSTGNNIERFLATNFYYSLEATMRGEYDNPAWNFLMGAGGGYCVHFATAYTLLARLAGIPARYVSGFLVNIPRDSDTVQVPGYASHAWVEIWTQESGWSSQEATPPMLPEFFDDPSYYELYNPLGSSYTGRQLELIMGDRIPPRPERPKRVEINIDFAPILIVLGTLICGAGLIWFILVSSRAPGSRKRRLRLALRGTLNKSLKFGAEHPDAVGWVRWSESVESLTGNDVSTAVDLAHRVYFGGIPAEIDDIRIVRKLKRRLHRHESGSKVANSGAA